MRAIVFTTGTPDTHKLVQSFTCLGHPTEVVQYDVPGVDVAAVAERSRPDVMVYIGAIKGQHNEWIPSTDQLCRANRAAPMIHICSDSADHPWWPHLEEYDRAGAFRLQVGIDGCFDSPIARFGMVTLTPIDPSFFPDVEWAGKIFPCGFAGGIGRRCDVLDPLKAEGLVEHLGDNGRDRQLRYEHVCTFYALCRAVVNDARTGTGERRHVKGRFVEAALAGAVLIEPHDSPAKDWYRPGIDYLVWRSPDDAVRHARDARDGRGEAMARRLQAQVRRDHSALAFWNKVLARTVP